MARLTREQTEFMTRILNNLAHNVDVVCLYLSGFYVVYDWKINGNMNAVRNNNNDKTFDYIFLTDYWGVAEINAIRAELQKGNESKAKQMHGALLMDLVKEYKKFLVNELKNNTGIQYRMTKDRFTKMDYLLLLQIIGIENTDIFVPKKAGNKIIVLRNIMKTLCNSSIQKRISLQQLLGSPETFLWLNKQRANIKNNGMSAALEVFDTIFSWNDYSLMMSALYKNNANSAMA